METIIFYTELIFVGFFIAGLELAFQYFMMQNMILYPYAVLLSRISRINEPLRHLMRPLGRCRYCNATWVAIYAYFILYGYNIKVLFLISIVFLWLKILSELNPFKNIDGVKVDEIEQVTFGGETPWQSMMISYLILGSFYALIYLSPIIIKFF